MATIQMYERLQKADDDEAAESMPEERGREAHLQQREARRKNLVFVALLVSNLVTLLVALYLAQKLYLQQKRCNDTPAGQGAGFEGQPLGGGGGGGSADATAPPGQV